MESHNHPRSEGPRHRKEVYVPSMVSHIHIGEKERKTEREGGREKVCGGGRKRERERERESEKRREGPDVSSLIMYSGQAAFPIDDCVCTQIEARVKNIINCKMTTSSLVPFANLG